MYCSNCGKKISDDSKFCSSCGSKVEIKEKQDTVTETPPFVVDKETKTEIKDIEQTEKEGEHVVSSTDQTPLPQKITRGWGWIILVCFYMGYILRSTNTYTFTSLSITTLGLIIIIVFYFWLRNVLLMKEFFHQIRGLTSFTTGVISFFLIGLLVSGSVGFIEGYQKRSEIREFKNNLKKQVEILQKQELKYSEMMGFGPTNVTELNDKILKIDEYKIFLMNDKKNISTSVINFLRETNSKYKKSKSVDEEIDKLNKTYSNVLKTSINSLDLYKKHLITGDKKFYNDYERELKKQQLVTYEILKLSTNIERLL